MKLPEGILKKSKVKTQKSKVNETVDLKTEKYEVKTNSIFRAMFVKLNQIELLTFDLILLTLKVRVFTEGVLNFRVRELLIEVRRQSIHF